MKTITLLFILLTISHYSISQTEDEKLMIEAIKASGNKDYQKSISLLTKAIKIRPDHPAYYLLRGEQYQFAGKMGDRELITSDEDAYEKAEKDMSKAIELNPMLCDAYQSRGKLHIFHQQYKKAIDDFTFVINCTENSENLFGAFADRGSAKSLIKDYQGAIDDYKAATKIKPKDYTIYTNIAVAYNNMGETKKAIKYLDKVLKIAPLNLAALNNLGFLYLEKEEFEKAMDYFNEILKISPNEPLAYNNRGFIKYKLGKFAEALIDINKSIELYSTNSYAYKNRALVYISLNDMEKACHNLNLANAYGYSKTYDNEVNDLKDKYCKK